MSVQALTWVLDHSTVTGAERLVLLSIANHADPVGANAWPSIETIAREAALGQTRTKTAIRELAAAGVVLVEPNAGGLRETRADRRPNRYTILTMPGAVDNPDQNGGHGGQTGDPRRGSRGSQNGGHGGQTGDREPSLIRPNPSSSDLDDFGMEALHVFAGRTTKREAATKRIRHPRRYQRSVYNDAAKDPQVLADLVQLRADYPTLTATEAGAVMAGERSILNAHERVNA